MLPSFFHADTDFYLVILKRKLWNKFLVLFLFCLQKIVRWLRRTDEI